MQPDKYRAQILLDPEQHAAQAQAAWREERRISGMIGEIVDQWLKQQDEQRLWEQCMQSLERLDQIRERIQQEYGVYQSDLLESARAERDGDLDRVWRGDA